MPKPKPGPIERALLKKVKRMAKASAKLLERSREDRRGKGRSDAVAAVTAPC